MKVSEPFVWPFVLTNEEIASWIALSDRMCGHISARFEEVATLEQRVERLGQIVAAIDGHDSTMLEGVVTRLKQSDGEGWAVGEMLERALAAEEEAV